MPLTPGDTFGPYIIEAPAGSGGMGEVYKARDQRLQRTVALKVIGNGLGEHPEARRRFASEARAIAALNHPHICTVFDTGHHEGRDFLVLEYLEGETLEKRLPRGRLNPGQVLDWGTQIAEALDYAHRRGIVHRDLKPANVHISRQGVAKLLDFGLAKLRAESSQASGVSGFDTVPVAQTAEGAIIGTLHYLAPERLDGRDADARSDVFAFGAVLYEMATGRKAFDEPTQARLIASILRMDPPPLDASSGLPTGLQWVLQNCLAKDPEARWQSMGDVAKVLRTLGQTHAASRPAAPTRLWPALAATALAAAAVASAAWLIWMRPSSSAPPTSVVSSVLPPFGGTFAMAASSVQSAQFALAPDGSALVSVAAGQGGVPQLWVRRLDRPDPQPLRGTENASYPFWSPDSRYVGFFADGLLKKVALSGRPPQPICEVSNGRGGAWRADNTIVFSDAVKTPLSRVDAAGASPVQVVTTVDSEHHGHRWPQFLPDGRVMFFVFSSNPAVEGTYVVSLDEPSKLHRVRLGAASSLYASGHLLFEREGDLFAQSFDPKTLALSGETVPLGIPVGVSSAFNASMSASNNGRLATWSGGRPSELVWFDARGKRLGTVGTPQRYVDFALAPDERRLALSRVDTLRNRVDLAILNLATGGQTPMGSSRQTDATPLWSPDGTRLIFRSNRFGQHDLFERSASGGADKPLYSNKLGLYPTSWSASDNLVVFHFLSDETKHDIWALDPRSPASSARALVANAATEAQGQLGTGRRLAYTSDELGRLNVYVKKIDGGTTAINVSVDGGFDPRWSADGRELFFIGVSGKLMAAELTGEDGMQRGPVRELFTSPVQTTSIPYLSAYVVTRDRRFLFNVAPQQPGAEPITLTLDWLSRSNSDTP